PYSKSNMAKYLKKSIEQYLPTVKLQDLDQPERASVRGKGASHE
ncbi:RepB protein, partial [Staphylococcus aureus]